MPKTVGEFYEDLRVVLARGNKTDAQMKVWSQAALKQLEREFTFDYMKSTFFLLLHPGARFFDFAAQVPPIPLKEIDALGYFGQDGGMIQFKRRNVQSMGGMFNTQITTYRTAGTQILFEGKTTPPGLTEESVSYPMLLHTALWSTWPTGLDESHPILDIADDLLKYQVLMSSTPSLRKWSELQGWKFLRDEALGSLRRLEDSKETEDDLSMIYRGGTDGRLYPSTSCAIAAICGMYDVADTFGVAGLYYVNCSGVSPNWSGPGNGINGGGGEAENPLAEVLLESGGLVLTEDGGSVLIE